LVAVWFWKADKLKELQTKLKELEKINGGLGDVINGKVHPSSTDRLREAANKAIHKVNNRRKK
jgi:predicted chitinase